MQDLPFTESSEAKIIEGNSANEAEDFVMRLASPTDLKRMVPEQINAALVDEELTSQSISSRQLPPVP